MGKNMRKLVIDIIRIIDERMVNETEKFREMRNAGLITNEEFNSQILRIGKKWEADMKHAKALL